MTLAILGMVVILGCARAELGQDDRAAVLETFVEELAMRGQFNGNVLVAEGGRVLFQKAVGIRSPTPGDMLGLDSQFNLASASKPFTALAVMQLKEAGLLSYDDLVEKHLPEWPYRGATIRNLLNHTSGIPSHRSLLDLYWRPELRHDDPERLVGGYPALVDLYDRYRPEPLFSPGEAYAYSDINYVLLASIVARVSGVPYHEYLRDHIFRPAGMQNTYAFSPLRGDSLANRARGMRAEWDGSGFRTIDFRYVDSLEGASGIYSTIPDLYRWDQALYTDLLLPRAALTDAFSPATLTSGETTTYGFGWSLYLDGCVSHDGYAEGYGAWINRELDSQSAIIILSNHGNYLWAGMIQGIREILNGEPYALPKLDGTLLIGQSLVNEGEKAAYDLYTDLKENRADEHDLGGVNGLNTLGHLLLRDGYASEAVSAFRLNAAEHPEVALVWHSLGDGYLALGDTSNAIASFNGALAIDPSLRLVLGKLKSLEER